MMKKAALLLINFYRRLRGKWYAFLTKPMLRLMRLSAGTL